MLTLSRFTEVDEVAEVVVAVPARELDRARKTFGDSISPGRRLVFVAGGAERPESVALALAATDPATDLVAIHDAVRPMIRPEVIREALAPPPNMAPPSSGGRSTIRSNGLPRKVAPPPRRCTTGGGCAT